MRVRSIQMIFSIYFAMALKNPKSQLALGPSMYETLKSLVVDISSPQQISIEDKMTIIDSLTEFKNNHWQDTQFMAWNTLKNIREALGEEKNKRKKFWGNSDAKEQFTLNQIDRLIALTEDRLAIFFGQKKENK